MTTKRLTAEDLAVIEVRANAATGGEWLAYEPMEFHGDIRIAKARDEYPDGSPKNTYVGRLVESHVGREKPRREDGAFIAAARTDVPDLIAEVRALTAERDELRTVFDALPRCVFAACENVATWKLDDFSVGCDAHREASVERNPWLKSQPELPYAKALRAMLAKKVTP